MRTLVAIPSYGDGSAVPQVATYLLRSKLDGMATPVEMAEQAGASPRVVTALKASVGVGTSSTWSQLISVQPSVNGWLESLRPVSAFFQLLGDGSLLRTPLRSRCVVATGSAIGGTASEYDARVTSTMSFDTTLGLVPRQAYGQIVVSKELVEMSSPAAASLLERELRGAAAQAADALFVDTLTASATSVASSGSTLAAALADLKALMGSVDLGARSRPAWLASPSVTKALANGCGTSPESFPDVGMLGGTLYGFPIIATSGISDSNPSLILVDCSSVAADATEIEIQVATQGDVQLVTPADSPDTSSTVFTSLWTRNLVAMRAGAYIGIEVLRAASVASLTNIAWAVSSPDSP